VTQCSSKREFEAWEEGFESMVRSGMLSCRIVLLGQVLELCLMGSSVRVLGGVKFRQGEEV
jgi:hypothetical protein